MKMKQRIAAAVMIVLAYVPAIGAPPQLAARAESNGVQVQSAQPAGATYRLRPNDVVQVKVFQEDELNTTVRILKDGTIPFSYINSAKIGDKTIQEAAQTIRTQLREYIINPQVTIQIVEYSKRRFTVLGQVGRPGSYDMPEESTMNLIEAIGLAGGYTRIANPSKITLKRQVDGKEVIYKLNGKAMQNDSSTERFEIMPGDTILVGESLL
jgi:protein involved in polysaccharide export with SLBB domain